MTDKRQSDKDSIAARLQKAVAKIWSGTNQYPECLEGHAECMEIVAELHNAVPELQPLSGETPRTDNFLADFFKDDTVRFKGPLADFASQLERELFVAQNDLGRFEESNRVAQETNDDLRQQLADALSLLRRAREIFTRQFGECFPEEAPDGLLKWHLDSDDYLSRAPESTSGLNDAKDAARWRQAIKDKEFPKRDRSGSTWMHVDRVTGDIIEKDTPEEVMDVAIANALSARQERKDG